MLVRLLVLILALSSVYSIQCPPGITSFATSLGNSSYFKCTNGEAVLSVCNDALQYDRYSGQCIKSDSFDLKKRSVGLHKLGKSIVNSDALGRIVSLGTLYDARKNNIWNGFSMWSEKAMKDNIMVQKQPYSKTRFFAEQNFFDRAALFNLDAEIKLSFLGGLIEVKGSAHYLRDSRETNEKIRVNMDYYAITDSETIPQSLAITHPQYCKYVGSDDGPTHVISSVTHGMRAVFVFERTTSNSSTAEEVGGSLSIAVKSIPSFEISGSAVVDVKGKVVENIDNIEVKFYGDIILEKTPSTYIDAIKVFDQLPSKVKDTKSVLKFQMTPIEFYCTATEATVLTINKNLVDQTSNVLEQFSTLQRDANSLTSTTVSKLFYSIRKSFNTFTGGLNSYANNYKAELIVKLPALKAGKITEVELVKLLNAYDASPYKYEKAKTFLEAREREVNTIELVITEALRNRDIEVTDSSTANDNTCIFKKDLTTIYVMYVLPKEDIAQKFINGEDIDTGEKKWFNDNAKVGHAGKIFKKFISYANINKGDNQCFLIQLKPLHENPNVMISIVAMKNGVVISDNFTIPDVPPTPTCKNNGYDSVNLNTQVTTNKFVQNYLIEYESLGADGNWTGAVSQTKPHTATITLTQLKPATLYRLQIRYSTVTGHGKASEVVNCKTVPSSEPAILRADVATESSISLKWSTPKVIAPGLPHSYLISIKQIGGNSNIILSDTITPNLEITLKHLAPSSLYDISVQFQHGQFRGPKATIMSATAPAPPPQPTIKDVAQNSAVLVIGLSSVKVADQTTLLSVTLEYNKLDDAGSNVIPGTTLTRTITIQSSDMIIEAKLSDLAAGTTYGIKYRLTISNIAGTSNSNYNSATIFKTTYKKSELEQFKETLGLVDIRALLSSQGDKIASNTKKVQTVNTEVGELNKSQTKQNTDISAAKTALTSVQTNIAVIKGDIHSARRKFLFKTKSGKSSGWAGEYIEQYIKVCGRRSCGPRNHMV